jgi:osmotically-inducible protein OsmY
VSIPSAATGFAQGPAQRAIGLLSFVILTVAFSWGQVRTPRPPISSPTKPAIDDVTLEQAIRDRFSRSKISVNEFQVRVRNGVAVLEGQTDVPQHKGTATRLAKNAGARRVDNRIRISQAGRQKASKTRRSEPRRVEVSRSEPRSIR